MPRISFTPNIQRHVKCAPAAVNGNTVQAVLAAYFAIHPQVRGYLLDDQGAVRHHMTIFINGRQLQDRAELSDPVAEQDEIYIFQALSGG